jgi:hypothetical protein
MIRQEHIRSQLSDKTREISQLKMVVHAMRDGTDEEATEILARMRVGENVEQLCNMLLGRAALP